MPGGAQDLAEPYVASTRKGAAPPRAAARGDGSVVPGRRRHAVAARHGLVPLPGRAPQRSPVVRRERRRPTHG